MDFGIRVRLILLFTIISLAGTGTSYILGGNTIGSKSKLEGGNVICVRKAPYQVYLRHGDNYFCGGALIKQNVVLTAAHCVQELVARKDSLDIVAGTDKPNANSDKVRAEQIKIHPKFSMEGLKESYKYDLAIVMLSENLPETKKIKPVPLTKENVEEGQVLFLSGIGAVDSSSTQVNSHLKAYTTIVVNCDHRLPFKYDKTYDAVICHKNYKGYRACSGDSGGPLVDAKGNLVGIHTRSPGGLFQVAINVFHYLDWINDEIDDYSSNDVFK